MKWTQMLVMGAALLCGGCLADPPQPLGDGQPPPPTPTQGTNPVGPNIANSAPSPQNQMGNSQKVVAIPIGVPTVPAQQEAGGMSSERERAKEHMWQMERAIVAATVCGRRNLSASTIQDHLDRYANELGSLGRHEFDKIREARRSMATFIATHGCFDPEVQSAFGYFLSNGRMSRPSRNEPNIPKKGK